MPLKGSYRPFSKFTNHLKNAKIKLQDIKKLLKPKRCARIRLNVQNCCHFSPKKMQKQQKSCTFQNVKLPEFWDYFS